MGVEITINGSVIIEVPVYIETLLLFSPIYRYLKNSEMEASTIHFIFYLPMLGIIILAQTLICRKQEVNKT